MARNETLGLLIEMAFVRVDVLGHELPNAPGQLGTARALAYIHVFLLLWRERGSCFSVMRVILPVAVLGNSAMM